MKKNKYIHIKALSKTTFINIMKINNINDDTVEDYKTIYFISINNPDEKESNYFKKQHFNTLTLYFSDCDDIGNYNIPIIGQNKFEKLVVFNDNMAKQIILFLKNAKKNNNINSLFVHCTAGISRSGAVCTFANDFIFKQNIDIFNHDNPNIVPNSFIYKKLKQNYEN